MFAMFCLWLDYSTARLYGGNKQYACVCMYVRNVFSLDWITVPLVYTHVINSVYVYVCTHLYAGNTQCAFMYVCSQCFVCDMTWLQYRSYKRRQCIVRMRVYVYTQCYGITVALVWTQVINSVRAYVCTQCFVCDWITLPLVYTQVITSVCVYLCTRLYAGNTQCAYVCTECFVCYLITIPLFCVQVHVIHSVHACVSVQCFVHNCIIIPIVYTQVMHKKKDRI